MKSLYESILNVDVDKETDDAAKHIQMLENRVQSAVQLIRIAVDMFRNEDTGAYTTVWGSLEDQKREPYWCTFNNHTQRYMVFLLGPDFYYSNTSHLGRELTGDAQKVFLKKFRRMLAQLRSLAKKSGFSYEYKNDRYGPVVVLNGPVNEERFELMIHQVGDAAGKQLDCIGVKIYCDNQEIVNRLTPDLNKIFARNEIPGLVRY